MSLMRNTERKDQVVQNTEASKYPQAPAESLSPAVLLCMLPCHSLPLLVQLSCRCMISVLYFIAAFNVVVSCNSLLE